MAKDLSILLYLTPLIATLRWKKTQGKIVIESDSVNLTEFKRKPDDPSEVSCTVYVDTANRKVYYLQDESDVLECSTQMNYFGGVCISRHSN